MFISAKSSEFLKYCLRCKYKKQNFTCGTDLCSLGHKQPCLACSHSKYVGIKEWYKPDEILRCCDFEEIK
jgi:hypothetical protein